MKIAPGLLHVTQGSDALFEGRGFDGAGADGVDAHALLDEIDGEGFGEA